jgi:hypothetical protein
VTIDKSSQQQIAEALFPELAKHCTALDISIKPSGTTIDASFDLPSREKSERLAHVADILKHIRIAPNDAA